MIALTATTTIIGAGPVGLSFALMRAHAGEATLVLDRQTYPPTHADARSLAISQGSVVMLAQLGVSLAQLPHAPIRHIHISEQGAWGHTQIHSDEQNVPQLGVVVRYADLLNALNDLAQNQPLISFMRPAQLNGISENTEHVELKIQADDTEHTLRTRRLIHAEGGLFSRNTNASPQNDYQQTALTATVTLSTAKPAWAWERFTAHGPCALLPLCNDGLSFSLVWCTTPADAARLQAADESTFLHELNAHLEHLTGRITGVGARHAFELGLKQNHQHSKRQCNIGNAAQTLHPVAGQGFNLGLRDAHVLNQQLNHSTHTAQALLAFTHERQLDRRITTATTDGMARGFTFDFGGSHVRSGIFSILNAQPWLKSRIAKQFMYGLR